MKLFLVLRAAAVLLSLLGFGTTVSTQVRTSSFLLYLLVLSLELPRSAVWGQGLVLVISRKTMARPDNLAQASQSRLGEMGRDSPRPFLRERSLRRPTQFLSKRASRPSETFRVALQWSGRNPMALSGMSSSGVSTSIHHKCKHPLNPTRAALKLFLVLRAAAVLLSLLGFGTTVSTQVRTSSFLLYLLVLSLELPRSAVWGQGLVLVISRKTMARPDNLAQASQSRLGEMGRDSPRPFLRERSLRRPTQFLSKRASRPSETFRVALQWSGRNPMALLVGVHGGAPFV
ncbi:hypothetical protein DEO72_LG5g2710 [Vigna unguiculata]|uniref:Uncharacterized protein n=1 Tax=Vigna unguiculata TaxID=3917 RepID=A0A4D6M0M2_VIGUN|nr:hypothetical protein DEO72_LG5g2710 [Vigna unguiculata]